MHIRVKICGIREREEAEAVVSAGADAMGLVFAESPRKLGIGDALELLTGFGGPIERVAVFHRPPAELLSAVLEVVEPDVVQAEPTPAVLAALRECDRLFPVFHDSPDLLARVAQYFGRDAPRAPVHLEGPGRGGRGVRPSWERAARLARRRRLILAGGLTPENVEAAIRHVRPYGVDVSSGVDQRPGVKSPELIHEFVAAVRRAEQDGRRTARPVVRVFGGGPAARPGTASRAPPYSPIVTRAAPKSATLVELLAGRLPDEQGRFGPYGGRFVPETLIPALQRLTFEAHSALTNPVFLHALQVELRSWAGRPTALTRADGLSRAWDATVYLKREDLAHTGAHKINNAIGQALLARRMGARRVIAETGAGQHGVAAAAACARLGMPCTVYMGTTDIDRQAPNASRIRQLGATLVAVDSGDRTLRSAIDEALRDWVSDPASTYYMIGSAVGPHPYPWLVRELQRVIGEEARAQFLESEGRLPDVAVACVGGGSNSIGLFHAFLGDDDVALLGIEGGGTRDEVGCHAATLSEGTLGVLHGAYSLLLQDRNGQVQETGSLAAGLDYPGVGPEHALLQHLGRASYEKASDRDALSAARECSRHEGILPALESAHALAGAGRWARVHRGRRILIGLSGRGDKDLDVTSAPRQTE